MRIRRYGCSICPAFSRFRRIFRRSPGDVRERAISSWRKSISAGAILQATYTGILQGAKNGDAAFDMIANQQVIASPDGHIEVAARDKAKNLHAAGSLATISSNFDRGRWSSSVSRVAVSPIRRPCRAMAELLQTTSPTPQDARNKVRVLRAPAICEAAGHETEHAPRGIPDHVNRLPRREALQGQRSRTAR